MSVPYAKATLVVDDARDLAANRNNNGNISASVHELELQPLHQKPRDQEADFHMLPSLEDIDKQSGPVSWNDWFYPPDVPRECQLLRKENIAIPDCYLLVGILQGLSGPLINVYPLDLHATEAQQVTVSSIRSLPASFKLLFGFWSDNVPLAGYRRKSYMMVGWILCSTSLLMLMTFSDLSPVQNDTPSEGAPSIPFLSLSLLGFGTGFWLADVMGDSLVAEKAKLESGATKGHLQSTCYACRFFGLMVAAPCSTVMYSQMGPYYVILLLAVLPLTIVPLVYWLGGGEECTRGELRRNSVAKFGRLCAVVPCGNQWALYVQ